MEKIKFLIPPKPLLVHRNYPLWGCCVGAALGFLVGYPMFMVIYVFHEYFFQQGPLAFTPAIMHSFSLNAWPLILFFTLSGALFGGLLGWGYSLLKKSRLYQEYLRKEFEMQVASLRHHYKNLAIGIRGFSLRVKQRLHNLNEVLKGICAQRDDCPGFREYSEEFQHLKNNVVTLDDTAENLEEILVKEVQFLRALASDCLTLAHQDLYQTLVSSIQTLLGLRFQEKEIKVEINGLPWEDCQETLPVPFEPYALEVVVQNVLSNAMQHGNHIQVRVLNREAQVQIEVEDNGPGLKVEKLRKKILTTDAIQQARSTHLGLTVSLYLLSKCGGRLGVASEPGKGATFYIFLPK